MKYKSGDVEKILGVSVETLRFFESIGLIKPERNPTNNYRYYDSLDLNKIVAYKFYRGYEFTLDESLNILNYTNAEVLSRLDDKVTDIREKHQYYEDLLTRLLDFKKSFEDLKNQQSFRIEKSPELLLYYNQTNNKFQTDELILDTTKRFLDFAPFVHLAVRISQKNGRLDNNIQYGYGVNTKFNNIINNLQNTLGEIYPSRKCIHTFIKLENNTSLNTDSLQPILSFMKKKNLSLDGDIIGWIVNEEVLAKDVVRYFELWIPIK